MSARSFPLVYTERMNDETQQPEDEKNKPEGEGQDKPRSAKEVAKKLEDFIKNTLGGQVIFTKMDGARRR